GEYKLKNKTQTIKENSLIEFNIEGNNPYEIYTVYKSYKAFNNEKDLGNFTYPNIDYIIFLDSDDYWELNCIEECVPRMEGVDIVWFDEQRFCDGINCDVSEHSWIKTHYKYEQELIVNSLEWIKRTKEVKMRSFVCTPLCCINFLYLRQINLKFLDNTIAEDYHFGYFLFIQCDNIYILPLRLYNCRFRNNSISNHVRINTEVHGFIKDMYNVFKNVNQASDYYKAKALCLTCVDIFNFCTKCGNATIKNLSIEIFLKEYLKRFYNIMNTLNNVDPLKLIDKINFVNKNLTQYYINNLPIGATYRIKSQLSYKLGQSIMINGKNFFTILLLPIILICIVVSHKQEIKYNKKYSKKKQLPLDMYKDYNDALLIKRQMTYRMGEIFIKSFKTWYKGGLFKLPFSIYSLY
ncbi:hypothetical protein I9X32_04965, partial [Campylobacter jejuni]|nr:hypothetical protein [Campylobacter jejuni]